MNGQTDIYTDIQTNGLTDTQIKIIPIFAMLLSAVKKKLS